MATGKARACVCEKERSAIRCKVPSQDGAGRVRVLAFSGRSQRPALGSTERELVPWTATIIPGWLACSPVRVCAVWAPTCGSTPVCCSTALNTVHSRSTASVFLRPPRLACRGVAGEGVSACAPRQREAFFAVRHGMGWGKPHAACCWAMSTHGRMAHAQAMPGQARGCGGAPWSGACAWQRQ